MEKQLLGAFIAENRKRQGMTQQQLAQVLHVTDKAVSKWERGLSYPDVTLLQPLAAAFRLRVDDLLTCRAGESEEYVKSDMTPVSEPITSDPATPEISPAVQAVLEITAENRSRHLSRRRCIAAIVALALILAAVLTILQSSGRLLKKHTTSPDGAITLTVYRDLLDRGTFRIQADQTFFVEGARCEFCGRGPALPVTRQTLTGSPTAVDSLQWSADGRYLLLCGRTGSRVAPAYIHLWDFTSYDENDPAHETDLATEILVTLAGYGDPSAPTAPLLPSLPGVTKNTFLPHVTLSNAHWLENEQRLGMAYGYNGTDGTRHSGTLTYDVRSGSITSLTETQE